MLEIWYVALPSGPLPSLFKWWPQGPKWPWAGGLGFETRKILKNLLLQNCLAQMLEIWYVALPSGPLPSLFKWWPQGPKWPWGRGSWVRN